MKPLTTSFHDQKISWRKLIIPFLGIEVSLAIGALTGVAILNWKWLGGLGMLNLQIAIVVGLIPSLILSLWISDQQKTSFSRVIRFSVIALILSACFSFYLGVAMVGI